MEYSINHNDNELNNTLENAIWIGKSIFTRNKTSGSSANMSFRYKDQIFITSSGSCFGKLERSSFTVTDLNGNIICGNKPSKELPLHLALYKKTCNCVNAVIHVHSFYATLWSCLDHTNHEDDVIPHYTPYLGMKLGNIKLVPYGRPGSENLFSEFRKKIGAENGYLLSHHGPIVGAKDLMNAFYALEELEESAHIAWELRKEENIKTI